MLTTANLLRALAPGRLLPVEVSATISRGLRIELATIVSVKMPPVQTSSPQAVVMAGAAAADMSSPGMDAAAMGPVKMTAVMPSPQESNGNDGNRQNGIATRAFHHADCGPPRNSNAQQRGPANTP